MNDKRYVYIQPINKIYDTLENKLYDVDSEFCEHFINCIKTNNDIIEELRKCQTELVRNNRQACLEYIVNRINELKGEK